MSQNISSKCSTKSLTTTNSLELSETAQPSLFELEIHKDSVDDKSLFSAISTPIILNDDFTHFNNDKLMLKTLDVYGRDDEKATLLKAFSELPISSQSDIDPASQATQRQLVLISGTSGTGKTKLTEILKDPVADQNGLFVRGKFALNMINQPYSGIASACGEICGTLLDLRIHDPEKYKRVGDEIMIALEAEIALLWQVIPVLEEIVEIPVKYSDVSSSCDPSLLNDSKSQILFAFRRFFRIIAKTFGPLVITLDDLQWADTSSFDLLEAMVTDREISGAMVIGIYRSNEVGTNPRLGQYLEGLEDEDGIVDFSVTRIEIKDLDVNAVNGIIQHVLACRGDARTLKLAELCHKKTLGNPFFLLQFLSLLGKKNLLKMTRSTRSWTWNLDEIERNAHVSENVVDLLKTRMGELPANMSEMLQVAACLGSTFDGNTLLCGWSRYSKDREDDEEFHVTLVCLEEEGLLVRVSSMPPRFSFVHDRIHEAAVDLVPLASRSIYRRNVGELLMKTLRKDRLSSEIFVVVNLLNDVEPQMLARESRLQMARLNYEASARAVMVSAFDSAARYAERGIAFLGDDALAGDTYDVSLGLFTIGAKSECAMGNVETLERYCMSVINRDDVPLEDKFGVFNTWFDLLMNRDTAEAVAWCIDILKYFDCDIPMNAKEGSTELERCLDEITTTARSHRLSTIPMMTDKARLQTVHWLDRLVGSLYVRGDDRLAFQVFQSLKLTFEYGISPYSSVAFAQTALILVGVAGDLQTAAVYGDLALEALAKCDTKALASRTLFLVHSLVFPWTKPLKDMYDPLMEAYHIGNKTGDTENMGWAAINFLQLRLYAGAPLDALQGDLERFMSHIKAVKNVICFTFMQPVYQAVLNLIGNDNLDDPSSLVGVALPSTMFDSCLDDPFFKPSICIHQCMLLTYFGEHVKHARLLAGMGVDYVVQALMAAPENMINTFLNGFSCFAAAHETGEERYSELGAICHKRIKSWVDMGNPNVKHYDLFLDAEYAILQERYSAAIQNYESAIRVALEGGFVQDAALACERLGEFHVYISDDLKEAERWIRQALGYWSTWGAVGKVLHMEKFYEDLLIDDAPREVALLVATPQS